MKPNGIAIIGAGMIGAAHAASYRAHLPRFAASLPDLGLSVICDANTTMAQAVASTYGFERVANDWKAVLADPSIGIVSIALPNFLHAEVVDAALSAGKHVLCEKPLALNAREAAPLVEKASSLEAIVAGTVFNYRRIPAIAEMHHRIAAGDIGDPVHLLVQYQADYAADPQLPHSWRYERSRAGAGALLDIGTHAIDLARFLCGEIDEVAGAMESITIKQRYLPASATSGHNRASLSTELRDVDNDDMVSALLRFRSGCQGVFTTSRVAVGMGNRLSLTICGTRGTLTFDSNIPGQYGVARMDGSGSSPMTIMTNRPAFPYINGLLPVPHDGVAVGYAESFGFMVFEFLSAIAEKRPMDNGSLLDGLRAAQVLDAIQASAIAKAPVAIPN